MQCYNLKTMAATQTRGRVLPHRPQTTITKIVVTKNSVLAEKCISEQLRPTNNNNQGGASTETIKIVGVVHLNMNS